MDMTSSTWRVLGPGLVALVLTLVACSSADSRASSDAAPGTRSTSRTSPTKTSTTPTPTPTLTPTAPAPAPADGSAPPPANAAVTGRARAALTRAGAQRLVLVPGYEQEVNTGFEAVWRGESLTAYVVPTSALPPASEPGELRILGRRHVNGHVVEVVLGQHSTIRMLRFERGPDTWLVTALDTRTKSDALVRALLS